VSVKKVRCTHLKSLNKAKKKLAKKSYGSSLLSLIWLLRLQRMFYNMKITTNKHPFFKQLNSKLKDKVALVPVLI
jgi:hypothetical protein